MTELLKGLVIRFPPRSGYLSVSRLNITAMAAGAGFDIEELDDLRLAVDEAVTWLVGDAPVTGPGPEHTGTDVIELDISCRPGYLRCRARRTAPDDGEMDLGDLANAILGATVDRFDVGVDGSNARVIELVKRTTVDG